MTSQHHEQNLFPVSSLRQAMEPGVPGEPLGRAPCHLPPGASSPGHGPQPKSVLSREQGRLVPRRRSPWGLWGAFPPSLRACDRAGALGVPLQAQLPSPVFPTLCFSAVQDRDVWEQHLKIEQAVLREARGCLWLKCMSLDVETAVFLFNIIRLLDGSGQFWGGRVPMRGGRSDWGKQGGQCLSFWCPAQRDTQ